jgi:hypothetical protein
MDFGVCWLCGVVAGDGKGRDATLLDVSQGVQSGEIAGLNDGAS